MHQPRVWAVGVLLQQDGRACLIKTLPHVLAGVVLNHLAWARMLNTPSALMALQVINAVTLAC
jgi:hypothetical protein